MKRVELKTAIVKKFRNQSEFAEAAQIHESRVSKILRGRIHPSLEERRKFEQALGEDIVRRVFDDDEE